MRSLFDGHSAAVLDRFPRRTGKGLAKYLIRSAVSPLAEAVPALARHSRLRPLMWRGQDVFLGRRLAWYEELGIGRLEPALAEEPLGRYYEKAYWDIERGEENTNPRVESDARGEDQANYIHDLAALPTPLVSIEFGPGRAALTCALHDTQPGGAAHVVEAAGSWRARLQESGRFAGVHSTLTEMAATGAQANLFLASHAVEHVSDLDRFLGDLDQVLAPGALAFIEVPNSNQHYLRHEGILIPHTYYFGARGMQTIAEQMGWELLDASCWGTPWGQRRQPGYASHPEGRFLRALLRKR